MHGLSRPLITVGVIFILLGLLAYLGSKLGLSPGHLPGDIRVERKSGVLFIPIGTSLLISIFLTIALNILLRVLRK